MRFQDYIKGNNQDTFFDISHISNKTAFLKDCISKSFRVWTDELDCKVSWHREKSDKKPIDVMKIAEKSQYSHYIFILRGTFFTSEGPYIEAGIRTNSNDDKDYFLWINIKPEKLEYFIKKYKLTAKM